MKNKKELQQWLEQDSYTKEDILHIVGKGLPFEQERPSTEQEIQKILGPACSGPSGMQYT